MRQALHLIEATTAQVATSPREGALVVSCVATFMMRWLIPRLYECNARNPKIEVRLSASHLPVDFARDGIDVAIRLGKPPWPRNVAATPFLIDRVGPVCAPALLAGRGTMRLADLRRCTLLSADTRPDAWADWAQSRRIALDPRNSRPFEHMYFMLEAAASGLGMGIASQPQVEEDLRSGRLVAPFGFTASGRSYCVLHAKALADNPKIAAFRSWITGRRAAPVS